MATTTTAPARHDPKADHPYRSYKGLALAVIAGAQLMVVLDATIVNIALPHIQSALNFSRTNLAWVLNAYTLTFGGLLLLGGRAGDIFGRRRMFTFGVLLFAGASLVGGFATSQAWLLAARVAQGVGGAIASPTALSLVTTTFEEGRERNKAFGIYAAVSGAGAAIGLIAGGLLTDLVSWRWVLFVNAPIGILIAFAASYVLPPGDRSPGHLDLPSALTSTAGVGALTYGFIHAATSGWSDPVTLLSFVASVAFLGSFLYIESRSEQPLMPLRLFSDSNRTASYVVMLSIGAALFAMFYFLTQYVQEILGYSPLKAGFAFLPVSFVIIVVAQVTSRIMERFSAGKLIATGSFLATLGLLWLSRIDMSSTYLGHVLPSMVVIAAGMGLVFVPITMTAVAGVRRGDAGIASAMLNVTQQVGGTIGLASLVSVSSTAIRNDIAAQIAAFKAKLPEGAVIPQPTAAQKAEVTNHALVHGWGVGFEVGALFTAIALVVALFRIKVRREELQPPPGMAPPA